jgi:hypothetical protein
MGKSNQPKEGYKMREDDPSGMLLLGILKPHKCLFVLKIKGKSI